MSLPVFSNILFFVCSSKIESVPPPVDIVFLILFFYNCNNRDSAGAELKKHAALSNSQCGYKSWIWTFPTVASLVKMDRHFLISNYNKWKYLALYCKRGKMFTQHTHTLSLTHASTPTHTQQCTRPLCSQYDCLRATHSQISVKII